MIKAVVVELGRVVVELEPVVVVVQNTKGVLLEEAVGVAELVVRLDLAEVELVAQNKTGFGLEDVEDQSGLLVVSI